jgi:hypothetical protein
LLFFALSAAALERPITPPDRGPAASVQYGAAVASDGDGYFAVWTDKRATNPEIWGTRVARDGRVLDATNIHIASGDITQPSVIWTGTSYLVVWGQANAAWALRVDRDGAIVDGPRVLIENAHPSSLAKNATHVVAGYTTEQNEVRALFLDENANVAGNVLLAARNVFVRGPSIAWNGTSFAAAWTAYRTPSAAEAVRFNLVSTIGPAQTLSTLYSEDVRIASDGDAWMVLAHHNQIGRYAADRYTADLDHRTNTASLPEAFFSNASILWTGTHYAVFADAGYNIAAARLAADGRLVDLGVIESLPITGSAPAPSAATNGHDVLVAWHGALDQFHDIDIFGTLLTASTLQLESRSLLSVSATKQVAAVVASGGTNLLAVWSEESGVYAKRLNTDGTPLDAQPLRLHDRQVKAAVVFNGSDYVVAWPETPISPAIITRRIPRDGPLRADGGGILGGLPAIPLAMASDGTTTLLAAGSRVVRLNADGSFLDTVPLILTDASVGKVGIAAAGGRFLFVWSELELLPPYYETPTAVRIRGARVTPSLTNLDDPAITIADTSANEADPAVAWNGSEWLVVWTDGALRGRRVARDGSLPGESMSIGSSAARPEVAWDGRQYVVAWHAPKGWLEPNVMHVAWLQQLGAPLFGDRVVGTSEFFTFFPVSFAPLQPGAVAAVYVRIAPEPAYGGVTRAFVNVLTPATSRRRASR